MSAKEFDPLAEEVLETKEVYRGRFLKVIQDKVRVSNGLVTVREYFRHPGAAMIIPMFDNGDVLLEHQWRSPLKRSFIEFPAGKLDPNESPLACAKRELTEETGLIATEWHRLGSLYNAIGYSNEEITGFLAKGLTQDKQNLDAGEVLTLERRPWQEVKKMVLDGTITDVKTIVGIFWLEAFLKGELPEK